MRTSSAVSRALTASAALMLMAGCSGGSQMAPTPLGQAPGLETQSAQQQGAQSSRTITHVFGRNAYVASDRSLTTQSFLNRNAVGKPLIFISVQGSHGHVDIYQQSSNPKMVGEITGLLPEGLATDASGKLYVANGLGSSNTNVLVYAPPYTEAPALTLADPGTAPLGVAVSASGVVAAGNDNGTVRFYTKNATTACVTVANAAHFAQIVSATFDDAGALYIAGYDPSFNAVLGKIDGGCNAKTITVLTTVNAISSPFGVQMTKSDQIAILDTSLGIIYTYNPPKMASLGTPVAKTQLMGTSPFAFAFLASGVDLYALRYNGVAGEFDYPAGGAPEAFITIPGSGSGIPTGGVAVFPPLVP